jgi:hypothetical protein
MIMGQGVFFSGPGPGSRALNVRLDLVSYAPVDRLLALHPLMSGTGRLSWIKAKGGRALKFSGESSRPTSWGFVS